VLSRRISSYQDTSSYFSILYGALLISVKRIFDEKMKIMENAFANVKVAKRSKVGILDTIQQFQSLAKTADAIFGKSERRNDLDKWYEKLADAVVAGINIVSESPNSKSPCTVVRFENFHQLYSTLSELKIECLDRRRKAVKAMYLENIDLYVREHMGRPLDRIQSFFEQIERRIDAGVRPEEVGYEQHSNRMELKRVVALYPSKEIRRGIENLYRKVEKHLCPESPLLQVVWHNIQDEFLKQIKHYEGLISECYPSSRPELGVSIPNVLHFFSDIAQQH